MSTRRCSRSSTSIRPTSLSATIPSAKAASRRARWSRGGVFEQAILDDAAAVICLHNHPSGNPEPSREDIRITRQLAEAGGTMGIPVHDHLIIAGTKHTSLAERGVID
ncbi:JAB domain-containing protein [Salinibacter ruber]|uniref:JAB domain-containing protein n=1 Tax=Salinibacter ruber TaxID=146919 RepID=UPI00311AAD1E